MACVENDRNDIETSGRSLGIQPEGFVETASSHEHRLLCFVCDGIALGRSEIRKRTASFPEGQNLGYNNIV